MALEVEGARQFNGRWWTKMQVDVSESAESVTFTARVYWHTEKWRFAVSYVNVWVSSSFINEGAYDQRVSESSNGTWDHLMYTATGTVQKTSSPQAVTITGALNNHSGYGDGKSEATLSYTVPARAGATYTVRYDANGGSGAPGAQSKSQGVPLTLSSTTPTRANFTFQGWSTSPAGGVAYSPGSTYVADASVTLYAVWAASSGSTGSPTVSQAAAYRTSTSSSTAETPSGAYAYVSFHWATNSSSSASTVRLRYKRSSSTGWSTATLYGTTSGRSGTAYAHFAASTSSPWDVEIYVASANGNSVTVTKAIAAGTSGALLDLAGGGSGLGVLAAAPASGIRLGGPRTYLDSGYLNVAGTDFTPEQVKAALGGGADNLAKMLWSGTAGSSVTLSESATGWYYLVLSFRTDMGRHFHFLAEWPEVGRAWNVSTVDTNYSSGSSSAPTQIYLKWNEWRLTSATRLYRSMSYVWGSDGQKKVSDSVMTLLGVRGLARRT